MLVVLSIFLAYLYTTFAEWFIHKYVLHGLGKKKSSWFNFHWHSHHKKCRKNKNKDINYLTQPPHYSVKKELFGLMFLLLLHAPVVYVSVWFYLTLIVCACRYFYMHRKSHTNTSWGMKKMPWHWKHHMGKNQDMHWGVTTDMWDKIFKTNQ